MTLLCSSMLWTCGWRYLVHLSPTIRLSPFQQRFLHDCWWRSLETRCRLWWLSYAPHALDLLTLLAAEFVLFFGRCVGICSGLNSLELWWLSYAPHTLDLLTLAYWIRLILWPMRRNILWLNSLSRRLELGFGGCFSVLFWLVACWRLAMTRSQRLHLWSSWITYVCNFWTRCGLKYASDLSNLFALLGCNFSFLFIDADLLWNSNWWSSTEATMSIMLGLMILEYPLDAEHWLCWLQKPYLWR